MVKEVHAPQAISRLNLALRSYIPFLSLLPFSFFLPPIQRIHALWRPYIVNLYINVATVAQDSSQNISIIPPLPVIA